MAYLLYTLLGTVKLIMKETIEIDGKKFVDYNEADLRFTGWEHECIIINRFENHYLIPLNRYEELKKPRQIHEEPKVVNEKEGASGFVGCSGVVGYKNGI